MAGPCRVDVDVEEEFGAHACITSAWLPLQFKRNGPWSISQFVLGHTIYEGRNSRLHHGVDKVSGVAIAVKVYTKDKLTALNRFQVEREVNIHISLKHENVINLYAAFEDAHNIYMVMELAGGGDLFSRVRAAGGSFKDEHTVQDVIRSFLDALNYLHCQGLGFRVFRV
ncbi:hypothetical protein FOA52_010283 [Chlamydomonas sp. UWO 241]|nr:hypothetical protein FOA52_010283 [Chlamydomonas sp. UWO 241]